MKEQLEKLIRTVEETQLVKRLMAAKTRLNGSKSAKKQKRPLSSKRSWSATEKSSKINPLM